MSVEISPALNSTAAVARPRWLRLRHSRSFTLALLMSCMALLWVSPFIWMLSSAFSTTRRDGLNSAALSANAG